MTTTLQISDLAVTYPGPPPVRALDGVGLTLRPGRILGLLGESGSGKSTLARGLLGLLDDAEVSGSLRLGPMALDALDAAGWRGVRWSRIALAPQSTASFNPVLRIGDQFAEPLEVHLGLDRRATRDRVDEVLERAGPGRWAAKRYPHELSGGQRRLALVAMALAGDPDVLVLDEPTAGLDANLRNHLLAVLRQLRADGTAILLLSHDLAALRQAADEVAVLYRGWVAESGPAATVLDAPEHPYTVGLLGAHPGLGSVRELRGIRGTPPDPTEVATGCPFRERCTQAIEDCRHDRPPRHLGPGTTSQTEHRVACVRGGLVPVLRATGVRRRYPVRNGPGRHTEVVAVDGVDLTLRHGEVLGLVGATGAGKSTLAQLLVRLQTPDAGQIELLGEDLLAARGRELARLRRRVQLLHQDPYEAISPRLTVAQVVAEPLDVTGDRDGDRDLRVRAALEAARLPADAVVGRRAHELSGGQLQRVALARALVLDPEVLICDESVAMLDPSEQAKLLLLLKTLQTERGMAMVFVSHDLATVLRISDRVTVLHQGRAVEHARADELLRAPQHPVTRRLLAAQGAQTHTPDVTASDQEATGAAS